ncbi:hypothetical protein Ocin01_14042 [Orchesella cincta]|uniref:F-box domain-containing protein n=1 Tax=Orchesella cincta TaxID=48709 RepID=A0A1D2MI17_ORCCI|nr:hypothetical protein Ocin01_14042 [Orchesella cincta]
MSSVVTLDVLLRHIPAQESQKYLFGRLDLKTLKATRCVNKLWQSLVDPILEFNVELKDDTKRYVSCFGDNRPVNCLSTTLFKGRYPPEGLALNVNMIQFTVDDEDENRHGPWPSNQRRIVGLTPYNFRRLINDFYFVEKLRIQSVAVRTFENERSLRRTYLPNLKEVIITFFDSGFRELMPFLQNYFPSLKRASIANVCELRKDRPSAYTRIFAFIARHDKILEDVTLIYPEGQMATSLTQPMVYRDLRQDHKMPQDMYQDVKRKLEGMKLEKILWDVSMMEGTGRYNLGSALLRSQTTLKELLLDNLFLKDITLWNSVGSILEKSSKTLKQVTLGGCMCVPLPLGGSSHFSCAWLKNCEGLEYLVMTICGMFVESIELLPTGKLRYLNLGHMLLPNQIEYIAQSFPNLEIWTLPQKGCKVNMLVPKINLYLFQVILHLPRLSKLTLCIETAEIEEILQYSGSQPGISNVKCVCVSSPKTGSISFSIDRMIFQRDQSELYGFIEKFRRELIEDLEMNEAELVEFFLRHVLADNNNLLPMER